MIFESILILAAAVMGLAIKPGAGMMMVMSRTLAQGMSACLAFATGFSIISIFFFLLVVFGYKFASGLDIVFISIVIKSFSAVYLIWLGVKGIQEEQEDMSFDGEKVVTFLDNLMASIFLTLSNPLTIVFYAGVLPTILDVKNITTYDILTVSCVITVIEFAVAIAYSLPILWCRHKMKKELFVGLRYFSSIVLILVGLYIGYTALPAEDLKLVF
jgi:threonine/homoserine/homoserine lactone efflux protein